MNTRITGAWGEALAAREYKRRKYKLIAMGYRSRFGEIDLIVQNKEYIVFSEVKLRKNDSFAAAREFVDSGKTARIRNTAEMWLAENETELQPRFDVVEIYAPDGMDTKNPVLEIIEDAF